MSNTHESPRATETGASRRPSARDMIEGAGCVLLCLDENARVVDCNTAAERLFGKNREQLCDAVRFEDLFPAASRRQASAVLESMRTRRKSAELELPVSFGSDGERILLWNLSRVDAAGATHVIAVGADITGRKWSESVQVGQNRVLELIAHGAELERVLDELVCTIEKQSPGMRCSVLVFDPKRQSLLHGAAPHLPEAYRQAIDGVRIGPAVGSCGTAAYHRERVIVERIETDPLWADFRELARRHGLSACWSQPIFSSTDALLGTFAMYYDRPRGPADYELELIERAAHLAGIALERQQDERERERARAQLQLSQKLESLGILAGGVAHDFNNLLVGVLGNADLARLDVPPDSPAIGPLDEIREAAERAADLCRQMLAFSGRGSISTKPVDLNRVVLDAVRLVKSSLSPGADVVFRLPDEVPPIEVDTTQLQQVAMNLVTNASDALVGGTGRITVATGSMECDEAYLEGSCVDRRLPAGRYVYLDVTDTGGGMDRETLERIFDPFFSTKFTGHGLGLAAVLGIVEGHHGALRVDSRPGEGTSFRILFPASTHAADHTAEVAEESDGEPWRGSGTILLVDDEPLVRDTARRMLERLGFSVIVADDGDGAVRQYRDRAAEIAGVILDLTMPGMSGIDTLHALRRIRADVPIMISSGFSEHDVSATVAQDDQGVDFIHKPYRIAELREMLRRGGFGRGQIDV